MHGEFFRWNEDPKKLEKYDGYVIGGGFSYEDRGRAGVIASLDPIIKTIKTEAEKGKPVLGICNGAQILVETGLVPGADNNKTVMALARNKRINEKGEILGTGYYNAWTHIKCAAKNDSCMFTLDIKEGEILHAPIAHGEGRFTTDIPDLMLKLKEKGQLVFRYCDKHGVITENFPVNPNGAMFNAAAICNPNGNVMAIMPHLERDSAASHKLFTSMKNAIIAQKTGHAKKRAHHLDIKSLSVWPLPKYAAPEKILPIYVNLIITDNEAETHELALQRLGWPDVSLKRTTYIELKYKGKPDLQKTAKQLIQSGVLLNTNKESAVVRFKKELLQFNAKKEKFVLACVEKDQPATMRILVREKPDFTGMAKLATIQKRLGFEEITGVRTGTLWGLRIPTKSQKVALDTLKKIVETHIFFNPHRQEAFIL